MEILGSPLQGFDSMNKVAFVQSAVSSCAVSASSVVYLTIIVSIIYRHVSVAWQQFLLILRE